MDRSDAVRQLANQYVATGAVAAVVLAGSLGRGRDDVFSDVELDVYWARPPTDDQRREPAAALGGEITRLWPYDADDAEWSEEVRVLGVDVTVSGFHADEIDRWIASPADPSGPNLLRQLRISAILEGTVLYGEPVVAAWRRAAAYPRSLAVATASCYLDPGRLGRWRLWPALVRRDDLVMLHRAVSDLAEVLLGVLCALNRVHVEHPSFKWAGHLTDRFDRAPADFGARLFAGLSTDPRGAAPDLHALLAETVELVAADLPEVDVARIEDLLRHRR
ncbi:MAG TPA: hypothetical protein VK020_08975 [Microlunatus sp.]|nr:hypothetical protein [Microlunatus sp.]